jgi:pyridoxamine 5'-phosphate oxidase
MNTVPDINTNDPFKTFADWLEAAKGSEINDPNAMNLATATRDGRPTNRMVLLNGLDERGFVFYTNAQSRKGEQLLENPFAALCFHWKTLRKQVRIEGRVEIVSDAEADTYYNSRPRQSRIGAWASRQSRTLNDYEDLKATVAKHEKQFADRDDIPRPPYWKGFRVIPDRIEFWIDGEFRLHKRYIFTRQPNGWVVHMINP